MKRKIEFVPIDLRGVADIYSIRIEGEQESEFSKFLILFRSETDKFLQDDFFRIVEALREISEKGAMERFFRLEGKISDRVSAIPLQILARDKTKHGTLRLYCLRVSDELLILGGGGKKTTDAYEQDSILLEAVTTLQAVGKELFRLENEGKDIEEEILNIILYID